MKITQLTSADIVDRSLQAYDATEQVEWLTPVWARKLISKLDSQTVVIVHDADDAALSMLRDMNRSYHVQRTGETYIAAHRPEHGVSSTIPRTANPFARRASRIPRFLLLHPQKRFTIKELAELAKVDKSVASRTVTALATEGLIDTTQDPNDERVKLVTVPDPRRLLDAWGHVWRRKRPRAQRFDIGTRNVEDTLRAVADAQDPLTPWVISGLAGAALVRRVVDPADVLLLTTAEGFDSWTRRLFATRTPDRGLLRVAVVPDDFPFDLARRHSNLLVADPVQLWLDTSIAGERAVEASEAVAKSMGW